MNQPKSSNAWIKWTALGCGGFLLLFVLVIGLFVVGIRSVTAGPEAVVKAFLSATAEGDYARAHDYFSAPLKQVQPLEVFSAAAEANPGLFDVVDTTFNNRSIDQAGASFSGTVTIRAGTKLPASFKLVSENDDWKLISYQIGGD